jgi:hypothetical protein
MIHRVLASLRGTELIPFYLPLCLALACGGCGSSGEAVAVKHAHEAARQQQAVSEAASILREGDDPSAVLRKALHAHGGKELARWKAGYLKYKLAGQFKPGVELTVEETYQLPDRLRREISMQTGNGKKIDSTVFLRDGKQRRLLRQGESDSAQPATSQEERPLTIVFLLDLLQDPETRLAPAKPQYVHGQPAAGLNVERKGAPAFTVYFDKATALLAKAEEPIVTSGARQATVLEIYYSDYQEHDGVRLPVRTTVMRQQEMLIEASLLEAQPLEHLERSVFQKP